MRTKPIVIWLLLVCACPTAALGSEYMLDEAGKLGPKGAMVMSRQSLGSEKVNGLTVTRMKDMITGKIIGGDMYGNQYGVDEEGKLGKPGEFRMLAAQIGTDKIDGVTVTKMKDLITGKITGTDMYGNQYGIDEKGKLGKAGTFRKVAEQVGTEKVDDVTVIKIKSLLDGAIKGSDAYGSIYVMKGGKLTKVK